jgi:ArsR family transcriptional regulator, arsenate/arsenite/antimonite-responsive transcriptional repressor
MTARNALASFAALAHPVRLALFRTLCDQAPERVSAGDLAQGFDIPPSTMTGHLQALERAGLIKAERRSRFMLYSLNPVGTRELVKFLVEDCCHNRSELVGKLADALAEAS